MPGKKQVVGGGVKSTPVTTSASSSGKRVRTGNLLPQLGGLRGKLRTMRGPIGPPGAKVAATNTSTVRSMSGANQQVGSSSSKQAVPQFGTTQIVGGAKVAPTSDLAPPVTVAPNQFQTLSAKRSPRDTQTSRREPKNTIISRNNAFGAALKKRRFSSNDPTALRSKIAAIRSRF